MKTNTRDRISAAAEAHARSTARRTARKERCAVRELRRQARHWGLTRRDLNITDVRSHPSYGDVPVTIYVEVDGHQLVASVELMRIDCLLFDVTRAYYRNIRAVGVPQVVGRGVRTAAEFAELLDAADYAASQAASTSELTSV